MDIGYARLDGSRVCLVIPGLCHRKYRFGKGCITCGPRREISLTSGRILWPVEESCNFCKIKALKFWRNIDFKKKVKVITDIIGEFCEVYRCENCDLQNKKFFTAISREYYHRSLLRRSIQMVRGILEKSEICKNACSRLA